MICSINDDEWGNEFDEKTVEIISRDFIIEETDSEHFEYLSDSIDIEQINGFEIEHIVIEDIISKNPREMLAFEVIQNECSLAFFIQVMMEDICNTNSLGYQNELNLDKLNDIIIYLKWISDASKVLATRINQNLLSTYQNKFKNMKPTIIRSSYNFFNSYLQCKKFYCRNDIPTCTDHHYVHSLLNFDIESILNFIKHALDTSLKLTSDEINNLYVSIKTICYITKHMAKEIGYIDYITKKKSEFFHRNNPIDFDRKKIPNNSLKQIIDDRNLRRYNDHHFTNVGKKNIRSSKISDKFYSASSIKSGFIKNDKSRKYSNKKNTAKESNNIFSVLVKNEI